MELMGCLPLDVSWTCLPSRLLSPTLYNPEIGKILESSISLSGLSPGLNSLPKQQSLSWKKALTNYLLTHPARTAGAQGVVIPCLSPNTRCLDLRDEQPPSLMFPPLTKELGEEKEGPITLRQALKQVVTFSPSPEQSLLLEPLPGCSHQSLLPYCYSC